ncbi:hypothetical protein [Pseudoalteromonas piscicida]|uniref:hypothetical protein n=1 Tax=Pseudoalteromonas piscicida TaxID=43662 RepID=UPI003C7D797A
MKNFDPSLLFRKAVSFLFVSNPRATSLGIFLGFTMDGLLGFISLTYKGVNFAAIKIWHLVAVGILGMNLPSYLNRNEVDPSITKAIEFIEQGVINGKINKNQAKLMYNQLYIKVLEHVTNDLVKNHPTKAKKLDKNNKE